MFRSTKVFGVALAAVLLSGCVQDEPEPVEAPVSLTPGKSDNATPPTDFAFDEEDARWELVEECSGYGLCLNVLVAGRDRSNFDADGFSYPMQRVIDELFFADNLHISPNCEGRLGFDGDQNVGCAPEDADPFIFGDFLSQSDGSDSTWQWNQFDYATPGRVRLFHDVESEGAGVYYLDIADEAVSAEEDQL